MKLHNYATRVAVFLVFVLLFTSAAFSQSYRGRVQGVVSDQSRAVVAGATVTLLNVGTGVQTVHQTRETGLYVFDLVDPGSYTLTVENQGFNKFVQEAINVQMRGDITVDVVLKPGSVQESVTVTETPVAVQFNSSNKDLTLDSKMAAEMPRLDRNPFKLTLLAPSAVNTRGEMMPYHSWAANSVDLGGGTNLKNDLQVDGSPIGLGHKNSYPPNTDAVQEVVVSQNSVDAESGHSAGGVISMTMKSGTNDWHGTGFYLGRYPWLNAEADRTRFTNNATRQHMYGGYPGQPDHQEQAVQLLLSGTLESGISEQLRQHRAHLPGARQATSRSPTISMAVIKTIYDPCTTTLNPTTGAVTRTPFAGNKIPQSRFDPLASSLLKDFWDAATARATTSPA